MSLDSKPIFCQIHIIDCFHIGDYNVDIEKIASNVERMLDKSSKVETVHPESDTSHIFRNKTVPHEENIQKSLHNARALF